MLCLAKDRAQVLRVVGKENSLAAEAGAGSGWA